jgi:hypothetical protein
MDIKMVATSDVLKRRPISILAGAVNVRFADVTSGLQQFQLNAWVFLKNYIT